MDQQGPTRIRGVMVIINKCFARLSALGPPQKGLKFLGCEGSRQVQVLLRCRWVSWGVEEEVTFGHSATLLVIQLR